MIGVPWVQMALVALAGWVNREQLVVIDYLKAENHVLRELHGKRRLRLNDDQRRRLAVKGKALGRRLLAEIGSIVQPDTILRWHRRLTANKYDGSVSRRAGRPPVAAEIRQLVVRIAAGNELLGIHPHLRRSRRPTRGSLHVSRKSRAPSTGISSR